MMPVCMIRSFLLICPPVFDMMLQTGRVSGLGSTWAFIAVGSIKRIKMMVEVVLLVSNWNILKTNFIVMVSVTNNSLIFMTAIL